MRSAVIDANGLVVNVIVTVGPADKIHGFTLVQTDTGNIGDTYNAARDVFVKPQPFPSWVLDAATLVWKAPVMYPNDGLNYYWDEPSRSWLLGRN